MQKTLLLALSILILTLFFYFFNEREKSKSLIAEMSKGRESHYAELLFYKNYFEINNPVNDKIMNVTCHDIINDGKELFLSQIVESSETPYLIFRYSDYNCKSCYEEQLELLQELNTFDCSNILILVSLRDKDYASFLPVANGKAFPHVYKISVNWSINSTMNNVPYYFVLYPNMTVSDVYMPEVEYIQQNRRYLKNVLKKLSN